MSRYKYIFINDHRFYYTGNSLKGNPLSTCSCEFHIAVLRKHEDAIVNTNFPVV